MKNIYLYLLSCAATILFVNILDNPARRFGLIDIPAGRKNHVGEVPLTGGLAMFLAIVLTVFSHGALGSAYASIFPALLLLVVTGACDDLLDLSAGSRFVAQAIAALLMIYLGKVAITDLGDLFGGGAVRLAGWSVPFTVFCVIGVINAVNMLDGIDGLAGGVALVVFMVFGGAALANGNANQATLLFVLAGAVAGFAAFNMRSPWRARAAVFMGDSGSMMLGFMVAWFAIDLTSQATKAFSPITAVWILAIPILDTVSLMLRRILKRRSPFEPDHDHLHHIFLRAGFSVQQTVALIVSLSLALGLAGIGAWRCGVPEYAMFYLFLSLFLLYFFGMLYAWKLMKIMRSIHGLMFG
jgi:UDP-GlcNAc:undecaprenyl-phosphate GlcNAc-1-phosphate transferase